MNSNNGKTGLFRLSLLSLSLVTAHASVWADGEYKKGDSPFAMAPLNIMESSTIQTVRPKTDYKQTTIEDRYKITGTKVMKESPRPYVMLLLDDSGSMDNAKIGKKRRSEVLRDILVNYKQDSEERPLGLINRYYRDAIFGLRWFNNNKDGKTQSIAQRFMYSLGDRPLNEDPRAVMDAIQRHAFYNATPTFIRYVETMAAFKKQIDRDGTACRRNYLILMTDGGANSAWDFGFDEAASTPVYRLKYFLKNNNGDSIETKEISRSVVPYEATSNPNGVYVKANYLKVVPWYNYLYMNYLINKYDFWRDVLERRNNKIEDNKKIVTKINISTDPRFTGMLCPNDLYQYRDQKFTGGKYGWTSLSNLYDDAITLCNEIKKMAMANGQDIYYYPYLGVTTENDGYLSWMSYLPRNTETWEEVLRKISGDKFNDQYGFYHGTSDIFKFQGVHFQYPVGIPQKYLASHAKYTLQYLSHAADAEATVGADGKKKYPIITFTIGFGVSNDDNDPTKQMLKYGASDPDRVKIPDENGDLVAIGQTYWNAQNEDQLRQAMGDIFKKITSATEKTTTSEMLPDPCQGPNPPYECHPISNTQASEPTVGDASSLVPEESYAAVSPGRVGGNSQRIPNMTASIFLPRGLDSSELRFYKVKEKEPPKDGELQDSGVDEIDREKDYVVPSFDKRQALVHMNGKTFFSYNTQYNATNEDFALAEGKGGLNDEYYRALMPYITRTDAAKESDTNIINMVENSYTTTPYRDRLKEDLKGSRRNMGDVTGAPILAIGKQKFDRDEFLVTAANDGMVYVFQSTNDVNHPYTLRLNYLPGDLPRSKPGSTIAKSLKNIVHPEYGQNDEHPHIFLNNGGFTLRHTDDNHKTRGEQIFMVGSPGLGGRGTYALNIGGTRANNHLPLALHNPKINEWTQDGEVTLFNATSDRMGYNISAPQIARISVNGSTLPGHTLDHSQNIRQAVFVASGIGFGGWNNGANYNNFNEQETALYIYDALGLDVGSNVVPAAMRTGYKAGELIRKVMVKDGMAGLTGVAVLDINVDGVADYAFAGDYSGNMYRFDLRGIQQAGSSAQTNDIPVKLIYRGRDIDLSVPEDNPTRYRHPITAVPTISRQHDGRFVVIFGTGSDVYQQDFTNTTPQKLVGVYQRFNEETLDPVDLNNPKANEKSDSMDKVFLQRELESRIVKNRELRLVTDEGSIFNESAGGEGGKQLKYDGWIVNLDPQNGERIVAKASMVLNTVFVNTRVYQPSSKTSRCEAFRNNRWNEKTWQDECWEKVGKAEKNNEYTNYVPPMVDGKVAWLDVGDPIYENGGTSVSESGCGDVFESYVKQRQTHKTEKLWTEEQTYRRKFELESEPFSWLLTFNSTDGGRLGKNDLGVDFTQGKEMVEIGEGEDKEKIYFTGEKTIGIANYVILSRVASSGLALNMHGETGDSGKDIELNKGETKPKITDCVTDEDHRIQILSTNINEKGRDYWIKAPLCPKTKHRPLRRISWRQLI